MFNLYSKMNKSEDTRSTGHDRFCQSRVTSRPKKRKALKQVRRTNSANEFDTTTLTAATKRAIFSSNRSASSEHDNGSDHSEHSEKSPLVSARLDSLARLFFSRSMPETSSRSPIDSSLTRPNLKYQYTALDSGNGILDRSPKERAVRDRALSACKEWISRSNGRYDIIAHLDEIGSRNNKNWFLISDTSVRTDRLLTLLPLPPDCVALEELPPSESPKRLLMELLGSLHHPYIYPILDLGFLHTESINYACLVTPFNPRGSLKDLIYKAQWNEPWSHKYTRKPICLPLNQIQRLGRQILEALLFLKERGFPLHGHLHSGNVILQNGVARLTGLENDLLGINSKVNSVIWSRSASDVENVDIICFGHLLYEMCLGYELNCSQPSVSVLEMDLERCPQILEILLMIFDPPGGCYPTVEDLVLCDLFRSIDLRELRGACVSTIKPSLSKSSLNLLQAVKRRQNASISGSFSEASSPCTPPSTPRERRVRTTDSFDISSDSESVLDEIVITSSSYDSHNYDILNSPIHFCDNSLQLDDNSSITIAPSAISDLSSRAYEEVPLTSIVTVLGTTNTSLPITSLSSSSLIANSNNQLTTDLCNFKNSKSRRLEYSLRCIKYGRSNPSQDSAFGSLTDGELSIGSSSFRLSSFQSITSPIDEGVEDMIVPATSTTNVTTTTAASTTGPPPSPLINHNHHQQQQQQLLLLQKETSTSDPFKTPSLSLQIDDSEISTSCKENSQNLSNFNTIIVTENELKRSQLSLSPKRQYSESISPLNLQFDPPKILVNDQNSIYTTSPSKKSNTIEVFSQKYRVSSFEDMSPSRKQNNLRNVNKMTFRSLEEERRIDSAFIPIKNRRTNSENRVYVNNPEKYRKLTHTSFNHRISNPTMNNNSNNGIIIGRSNIRDRHTLWRDSEFYRKPKIVKSNDSLLSCDYSLNSNIKLSPSPSLSAPFTLRRENYELKNATSLNRGSSFSEIPSCTSKSKFALKPNRSYDRDIFDDITSSGLSASSTSALPFTRKTLSSCILTPPNTPENYLQKTTSYSRKSRSERYLFNLSKLKQTAINDCFSDNDDINPNNLSSSSRDNNRKIFSLSTSSINNQQFTSVASSTFTISNDLQQQKQIFKSNYSSNNDIINEIQITTSDSSNETNHRDNNDIDDDRSSISEGLSPLHQDVCKIIGGMDDIISNSEEKTPLLDSMEMSPILSPTDPNPPDGL